jgi:hypothetical protein
MGGAPISALQKWPICPISVLREKFNPRNINHMPAVKFFGRLDLGQICLFLESTNFSPMLHKKDGIKCVKRYGINPAIQTEHDSAS